MPPNLFKRWHDFYERYVDGSGVLGLWFRGSFLGLSCCWSHISWFSQVLWSETRVLSVCGAFRGPESAAKEPFGCGNMMCSDDKQTSLILWCLCKAVFLNPIRRIRYSLDWNSERFFRDPGCFKSLSPSLPSSALSPPCLCGRVRSRTSGGDGRCVFRPFVFMSCCN